MLPCMMRAMRKQNISELLRGGDRRSIGRADAAAGLVKKDSRLFAELIAELWSGDALVRMRAADAVEKVTRENPGILAGYKKELLGLLLETEQQELRWHLAVMVPRLALNEKDRRDVTSALASYLEDRSSIVKTFALQGLADLAEKSGRGRDEVMEILHSAMRNGTAAMKARARKLLGPLEDDDVEDKAQRAKRDSLRQTRGKRHRFALRRPRLE